MYKLLFQRLAETYSSGKYEREYLACKEHFFSQVGAVFDDEDHFEAASNMFLEWYLFDRSLNDSSVPPLRNFWLKNQEKLDADELALCKAIEKAQGGIFEVLEVSSEGIRVKHLVSQNTFFVAKSDAPLTAGDVIDARFYHVDGVYTGTQAVLLHEDEAKPYLRSLAKLEQASTQENQWLMATRHMKLKIHRYAHVKLADVYSEKTLEEFIGEDHA